MLHPSAVVLHRLCFRSVTRCHVTAGPQVNIAGHKFSDKDALWTHCKQMVEELGDEAQLTGENAFFAFAMLAHHPECTAKMGDGLQAIRWGTNPEFPDTKVLCLAHLVAVDIQSVPQCFLAMRKDGTEAGFSYRKCIDSAFNNISRRGEKRQREEHTTKFQPGALPFELFTHKDVFRDLL